MEGQTIGDAVLKFLGDSTDLDTKFDEVGPNAEKAFKPAADAVKKSAAEMKTAMREAKAEVGLLGEEVGIRLPRHVRAFLAEIPGVSNALSAAFNATAVLFLLQALVEGTEKISDWISKIFIMTDTMKENEAAVAKTNDALVKLNKQLVDAKEKEDALTGALKDGEAAQIASTKATVADADAQLATLKARIANKSVWDKTKDAASDYTNIVLGSVIPGYFKLNSAVEDSIRIKDAEAANALIHKKAEDTITEERKVQAEERRQRAIKLAEEQLERDKQIALAGAQTEEEKYQITRAFEEKKLQLVSEYGEKERKQVLDIQAKIEAAEIAHANKMTNNIIAGMKVLAEAQATIIESVVSETPQAEIALTKIQQALLKGVDAARSMGVAVRLDLVEALYKAQAAEKAFAASGIQDAQAMAALKQNTVDAQKALDNYGRTVDSFKIRSHGMWAEFQRDAKAGATAMDHTKQLAVDAFDGMSKSLEGAFAAAIAGQKGFGQALEQATAQALIALASQAAVKALFYTAEGFAELALGVTSSSASELFTAAGIMASVATAAGVSGAALSGAAGGGGGGSSNHQQGHDSVSNTGSSNRSGGNVTGVQAFAEGGIITGPTIALMGEAGREAVIPLDDPQAKQQLQGVGGGGGTTHHWHIDGGMISADSLTKVVKQISRMVDKGQVHLKASDSLRVTKRSA